MYKLIQNGQNDSCMLLAPEHIPTIDKVNDYLRKRAQGDLCRDVTECNTWAAEAFLMDDLRRHHEHSDPVPHATLAETRLYLRAVSWFQYPALTDLGLLERIDQSADLSPQDKSLLHGVISEQRMDDAVEPAAQRIDALSLEAWSTLQAARRTADIPWRSLVDEALPSVVIEAKAGVDALRPIRDAVYFRRHLSHWLAWGGRAPSV